MNIFDRLKDKLTDSGKASRRRSDPMDQVIQNAIAALWTENDAIVSRAFSRDFVRQHAQKMYSAAWSILEAQDPFIACREEISIRVWDCARFQVLIIEPPPLPDPTGLRGRLGITGELRPHISRLITLDEPLKETFSGFPPNRPDEDNWEIILMLCCTNWAMLNIIDVIRRNLGDCHPDDSKDWAKPYIAATCAWVEASYRKTLDLPETLVLGDVSSGPLGMVYMRFQEFVDRGDKYPNDSWREFFADRFPNLEQP